MGRRTTGTLEIRATSIRLKFTHLRRRRVETLDLNPTPANIKAAERLLARIVGAIEAGVYRREDFFEGSGPATRATFAEYADEWLKTIIVEKSTRRSYKTALSATWKPALGDKLLPEIKRSDIKTIIAARAKTVSGKTINNHLIVVRAIFESAMADDLIAVDPTEKIKNLKHQAPEPDPFTAEEKDLVLGHMQRRYDERVWNYYEFAFHTGLRPSEEIALKWADIDWRRKKVLISRAQVDYEEKGTKTHTVREIDLNDRALAALTRQKAYTFMKDPDGEAYVFSNPNTGKQWQGVQAQLRCFWNPTLRALGLRHRDAYQTRHTFATMLLMAGVNVGWIAKQMGHAKITTTLNRYARWIDGADKGAEATKANELFGHNGGPPLDELSQNCPRY